MWGRSFRLESHLSEDKVILESFIHGKEFSCIVIRDEDRKAIALPPTEIVKSSTFFDYRSKYMPGFSRKVTPIDLPQPEVENIRKACERLFEELGFQTYARIDGFITPKTAIFLNDPNTTSGMLPSSFFFHQAAEIGLNPSQFITYIIRTSLQERMQEFPEVATYKALMEHLDDMLNKLKSQGHQKKKIGVILGGYSFERHISVESGRNVFEKLSSSEKYEPIPIFLSGNPEFYELFRLPINLLLKDNADDIKDKIVHFTTNEIVEDIKTECVNLTNKYASEHIVFEPEKISYKDLAALVDGVFIALHGRPGEDGQVQMKLEAEHIPYNGSGIKSSNLTINKYKTLQTLKRNGFTTTEQILVYDSDYHRNREEFVAVAERRLGYPFVAKPVDDGCSSAVKVIRDRDEFMAYSRLMFRPHNSEGEEARHLLNLKLNEEFPRKPEFLLEALITGHGAKVFMEVTGGLLTHYAKDGQVIYEIFEPSEALASEGVLSLEEKFLAGEGQNITPARFSANEEEYAAVAADVKATFERAARILDVRGYARIDAFVRIFENNRVETIIIEVNSLPGMTPATVIFHQAALNGYKPFHFIDRILSFSLGEKSEKTVAVPVPLESTIAAPPPKPVEIPEPQREKTSIKQMEVQPQGNLSYFFSSILSFFRSMVFVRNCLAILAFMALLLFLLTSGLKWYTKHGQSQEVQNYEGMLFKDAFRMARRNNFRLVVNDSVFMIDREPNIIIDQTPKPKDEVKENRRIYVTVTSITAPLVPLPSLVGNYDYDQYTRKLQRLGLKFKIRERKFNRRLEENTILHFYFEEEQITDKKLRRGVKVPKGSLLEFVVSERNTGQVEVPNLVCKSLQAAQFMLNSMDLVPGDLYGPTEGEAYIYKQEPPYMPGAMIRVGTTIHLYLQETPPIDCPEEVAPGDLGTPDTTSTNNF